MNTRLDILKIKKVIFFPNKIVLIRKKDNITINVEDIDYINYTKPFFGIFFY